MRGDDLRGRETVQERKQRERAFHDQLHGDASPSGETARAAVRKWYQAGRAGYRWLQTWLYRNAPGRAVLDYGCGAGGSAIELARMGATVTGIDISASAVDVARSRASAAGVEVDFRVMDAERTEFPDGAFDIVVCNGILHHLDLDSAYREIARILKPHGTVIAVEALGHNPLINLYRRRTPQLRSADERPLRIGDLELARRYFGVVEVRYFGLVTLAAAPLWRTPLLGPAVRLLSTLDAVLLRIPGIRRWAWMVGILLRKPRLQCPGER